jgi:uroporphyrinogen-III synthase
MHLVVTRPPEDIGPLQAQLEAMGHTVLASPMLEIADTGSAIPDRLYQAVLVTSANGARAIARHPRRAAVVTAPAVTVGPASASAGREAGFATVETAAGGNVEALIAHVIATRKPEDGPLLYASGDVTTGDLEQVLGRHGFAVDRVVLYRAVAAATLTADVDAIVRQRKAHAVMLYSPRTARTWVEVTARSGLHAALEGVRHLCISANTADVVRDALPQAPVSIASHPTEQSMLELVAALS